MKKYIYSSLFIAVALLAGCSKSEPEPEPAEQVIGSYAVDKVTIALKYDNSPIEEAQSFIFPYKSSQGELTAVMDVTKSASNIVTLTYVETFKPITGSSQKTTDVYTNIELKKSETTPGVFDLFNAGIKSGTIGSGTILYDDITNSKDSLGRAFKFTYRVSGKKAQ